MQHSYISLQIFKYVTIKHWFQLKQMTNRNDAYSSKISSCAFDILESFINLNVKHRVSDHRNLVNKDNF